jgi:hypothetical protein
MTRIEQNNVGLVPKSGFRCRPAASRRHGPSRAYSFVGASMGYCPPIGARALTEDEGHGMA